MTSWFHISARRPVDLPAVESVRSRPRAATAVVHWLLAVAMAFSLGAHWMVLQTVAWTGMVVSFSRQGSLRSAIARTFDGQHPCGLCKFIRQGRADEQERGDELSRPSGQLDPRDLWHTESLLGACVRDFPVTFLPAPPQWRDPPPKPRPRLSNRRR